MQSGIALMRAYQLEDLATLVVATSGGVDSMVLLTLLAQTPYHVVAAHFDHRLRAESQQEGELVAAYAKHLGVACVRGHWDHPVAGEAAARTARYAFLEATCRRVNAPYLVVAHHGDDQLETILLQLARSGNALKLAGLKARSQRRDLVVLRPLLHTAKAALYAYAKAHGVPYAEDPSNADETFARNRVRHTVVPALKAINPQVLAHTARFSEELSGLIALAQPQLDALLAKATGDSQLDWAVLAPQPLGVRRLVLAMALANWGLEVAPEVVSELLAALDEGAGTKYFDVGGGRLAASYGHLSVVAQPPLATAARALTAEWQPLDATDQAGLFDAVPDTATAWALVPPGVVLRHRQAGDSVVVNGKPKKLRRWLIDHKVPRQLRDQLWVAAVGSRVYWVQGQAFAELFHRPQTDIMQAVLALKPMGNDSEDDNGN